MERTTYGGPPRPLSCRGSNPVGALKKLWAWFQATPIWQAWQRYSGARGNLLAGGVTYFAFFSLFPAIALGFTIFGFVLRDQPGLLRRVQEAIEQQLPGFVQTPENPDGLIPLSIPSGTTLSITAAVSIGGLLWAGLGWLGALRDGIRAIFHAKGAPGNFFVAKLRDLGVLATLGVSIVLAAVVNAVTSSVAHRVAEWVGLGGAGWLVTIVGLLASFLANGVIVALMLRILSGVNLPWRGVRNGAIFGGIAMTLLQTFAARLIAGTTGNKLFASIALVVGLLAFLNFISRAMLLSAAWAANDLITLDLAAEQTSAGEAAKLAEGPATREQAVAAGMAEAAGMAGAGGGTGAGGAAGAVRRGSLLPQDAQARLDAGLPTLDPRAADRATLASGAVLGATLGATVGAGLTALAGAARRLRRR